MHTELDADLEADLEDLMAAPLDVGSRKCMRPTTMAEYFTLLTADVRKQREQEAERVRAQRAVLKAETSRRVKPRMTDDQRSHVLDAKWENTMERRDADANTSGAIRSQTGGHGTGALGRGRRKRAVVVTEEQLRAIASRKPTSQRSKRSKRTTSKSSRHKKKRSVRRRRNIYKYFRYVGLLLSIHNMYTRNDHKGLLP